jgi:predicted transcriptional regulator
MLFGVSAHHSIKIGMYNNATIVRANVLNALFTFDLSPDFCSIIHLTSYVAIIALA